MLTSSMIKLIAKQAMSDPDIWTLSFKINFGTFSIEFLDGFVEFELGQLEREFATILEEEGYEIDSKPTICQYKIRRPLNPNHPTSEYKKKEFNRFIKLLEKHEKVKKKNK
ncbi:MAG: hypothetical protein ACRCXZ_02145 [Patescibacteria group bacterium]